jgi:hypothetical protein
MASQQRYAYDGHDIVFECVGLNSGWFFYTMGYNFWVPDGENSLLISVDVVVGYMLRPSLIHWTFSDAQQTTTDIVQSNDEGTEFHRLNHIVYDSTGNTVATWRHTYGWGGPTDHLFTRYLKDGNERDWLTGLYFTSGWLGTEQSEATSAWRFTSIKNTRGCLSPGNPQAPLEKSQCIWILTTRSDATPARRRVGCARPETR